MEKVNLPTFVKVLMNAEVLEDCKGHPNEALHDKSVVRIIDPNLGSNFIVETNKIEPEFTAKLQTVEVPTKITIRLSDYSVEAELLVDGAMFCVNACGDLQSGIAAFGDTVASAVRSFRWSCENHNVKNFGKGIGK